MPVLAAERISKRFQGTQALDEVSFALEAGEVHALIGENGAGKSTLIRILGGVHRPDRGTVLVEGRACRFASPRDALAAGVVVIPQEMRVVPALSVAENVLLGAAPMRRALGVLPWIDGRAMRGRAAALLARLNLAVDPATRLDRLGYAERQLVMIARALSHRARALILDEPTAALESREVARLFDVIAALKAEGVAIVYVSHRLDEVEAVADRCTVLRDGALVECFARGERTRTETIRLMTGRDLEAAHAAAAGGSGATLLRDQAIEVRAGRVTGLAGLLGSGTTAALYRVFGAGGTPVTVERSGVERRFRGPSDAIAAAVGLVPGERALGLVMGLTVRENIVLPNLPKLAGRLRLRREEIDRLVHRLISAVDIRPPDPDRPVRELSGGNQQKVIFARWLAGHAEVLLLDEPTHGVDVGAKAQIHRLIRAFVADGGGVALASSEMEEVLAVSDEVLAMRRGEVTARLAREDEGYTERALRDALGG